MYETAEKAVKKFFLEKMDDEHTKLRNCALYDLHFGPMGKQYYADSADFPNWPGYTEAIAKLEEWASTNLSPVWVDAQTMEVLTAEPEEDYGDSIYAFDRAGVAKAVFWKLVTDGGMSA